MTDSQSRRSTAGRVTDHGNGTYSVYFYAGWQGRTFISVTLVHPREAVLWIDGVYRTSERNVDWFGHFESNDVKEESICYLLSDNTWTDKCEYRNVKTLGHTVFVCEKPPSLSCNTLKTIITKFETLAGNVAKKLANEQRYLFESPYLMTPIKDSPFWIDIKEPDIGRENIQTNLPKCGPDLPMPLSDGFWESFGVWTSLTCKARHWAAEEIRQCLIGKTLYMIGDSTLRQWHEALTITLGERMDFDIIRQSWTNEKYHTSFIFEFHAILVGTYDLDFWGQKFEGDILDDLQRCNYIIVLSLTYHFPTWNINSYTERLRLLRQAIIRLKARCPEIVIVVKSSHPRDHTVLESYIHSSDWTLYDMNRLLREHLGGLGALFVEVWDMSLSHSSDNDVHVTRKVVRQQVDLFLSYICT
ncbi:NXPE family member 3-like [Glandiceps talaboti]